uniref:Uncharacterized protein n=1 Tax=Parascaris equorum TaxID=6256 RepID=A0A914RF28_PAREQ
MERNCDLDCGIRNILMIKMNFLSRRTTEIAEDVLLDSGSRGDSVSSTRADLSQGDLSSYKKRIDANVEQQREHSDMMAGLQRKNLVEMGHGGLMVENRAQNEWVEELHRAIGSVSLLQQ